MSLGVVIKGPEGIVLAADSRVSLQVQTAEGGPPQVLSFDNATKLLRLNRQPFVGAITYGAAIIGLRTAHSFLPEFENLPDYRAIEEALPVEDFAKWLSGFFQDRWREAMPPEYPGPDMTFVVGGFDPGAAYGRVFMFAIPRQPQPVERNPGNEFGMTWGGQLQIATRIIHGHDPVLPDLLGKALGIEPDRIRAELRGLGKHLEFRVPYEVLPLQDCVNLATFMVRTTITAQALAIGVRGVGGPIDVATITRTEGFRYVQRKRIRGERKDILEPTEEE